MIHGKTIAHLPGNDPRRPSCLGALTLSGSYPDRVIRDGRTVERIVETWTCAACGGVVVLAGHLVLNAYDPPRPGPSLPDDFVREIARAWRVPDSARKAQGAD